MADNNLKKVNLFDKLKIMSPRNKLIVISIVIFLITVALEAYSIYSSK